MDCHKTSRAVFPAGRVLRSHSGASELPAKEFFEAYLPLLHRRNGVYEGKTAAHGRCHGLAYDNNRQRFDDTICVAPTVQETRLPRGPSTTSRLGASLSSPMSRSSSRGTSRWYRYGDGDDRLGNEEAPGGHREFCSIVLSLLPNS